MQFIIPALCDVIIPVYVNYSQSIASYQQKLSVFSWLQIYCFHSSC